MPLIARWVGHIPAGRVSSAEREEHPRSSAISAYFFRFFISILADS